MAMAGMEAATADLIPEGATVLLRCLPLAHMPTSEHLSCPFSSRPDQNF